MGAPSMMRYSIDHTRRTASIEYPPPPIATHGHVDAANLGRLPQGGGRGDHGIGLIGRAGAEGMVEVGDGETPAAVGGQRGRSMQQGSRVRAAGDRKHDGGAIGDLEASHALGQGVSDRRQWGGTRGGLSHRRSCTSRASVNRGIW